MNQRHRMARKRLSIAIERHVDHASLFWHHSNKLNIVINNTDDLVGSIEYLWRQIDSRWTEVVRG